MKHVVRADTDADDAPVQAALGFDRTFQMTVEWMEAFEEELRAEMVENKAKYVGFCGGEKEYETWLQLNVGHKVNHPVRYAMAQPCARTHTHTHTHATQHTAATCHALMLSHRAPCHALWCRPTPGYLTTGGG